MKLRTRGFLTLKFVRSFMSITKLMMGTINLCIIGHETREQPWLLGFLLE